MKNKLFIRDGKRKKAFNLMFLVSYISELFSVAVGKDNLVYFRPKINDLANQIEDEFMQKYHTTLLYGSYEVELEELTESLEEKTKDFDLPFAFFEEMARRVRLAKTKSTNFSLTITDLNIVFKQHHFKEFFRRLAKSGIYVELNDLEHLLNLQITSNLNKSSQEWLTYFLDLCFTHLKDYPSLQKITTILLAKYRLSRLFNENWLIGTCLYDLSFSTLDENEVVNHKEETTSLATTENLYWLFRDFIQLYNNYTESGLVINGEVTELEKIDLDKFSPELIQSYLQPHLEYKVSLWRYLSYDGGYITDLTPKKLNAEAFQYFEHLQFEESFSFYIMRNCLLIAQQYDKQEEVAKFLLENIYRLKLWFPFSFPIYKQNKFKLESNDYQRMALSLLCNQEIELNALHLKENKSSRNLFSITQLLLNEYHNLDIQEKNIQLLNKSTVTEGLNRIYQGRDIDFLKTVKPKTIKVLLPVNYFHLEEYLNFVQTLNNDDIHIIVKVITNNELHGQNIINLYSQADFGLYNPYSLSDQQLLSSLSEIVSQNILIENQPQFEKDNKEIIRDLFINKPMANFGKQSVYKYNIERVLKLDNLGLLGLSTGNTVLNSDVYRHNYLLNLVNRSFFIETKNTENDTFLNLNDEYFTLKKAPVFIENTPLKINGKSRTTFNSEKLNRFFIDLNAIKAFYKGKTPFYQLMQLEKEWLSSHLSKMETLKINQLLSKFDFLELVNLPKELMPLIYSISDQEHLRTKFDKVESVDFYHYEKPSEDNFDILKEGYYARMKNIPSLSTLYNYQNREKVFINLLSLITEKELNVNLLAQMLNRLKFVFKEIDIYFCGIAECLEAMDKTPIYLSEKLNYLFNEMDKAVYKKEKQITFELNGLNGVFPKNREYQVYFCFSYNQVFNLENNIGITPYSCSVKLNGKLYLLTNSEVSTKRNSVEHFKNIYFKEILKEFSPLTNAFGSPLCFSFAPDLMNVFFNDRAFDGLNILFKNN